MHLSYRPTLSSDSSLNYTARLIKAARAAAHAQLISVCVASFSSAGDAAIACAGRLGSSRRIERHRHWPPRMLSGALATPQMWGLCYNAPSF